MKFAIYGDSFAESSCHLNPKPELNSLAWTTLLAQRLGATAIDYYALGGSSLFYSYQRMLESADQYDRAIIAVSEPNRYTKDIAGHNFTGPPLPDERYEGVSVADMKHLMGWFASLDEDFMEIAQELLIRDIEARWPTTVIVPSFPHSFTAARAARWHNFGLLDINLMGLKQLKLNEGTNTLHERHTVNGILCHIPVEWHSAVADLIYNFLQTGSIVVPPLVLKNSLGNYYTSS